MHHSTYRLLKIFVCILNSLLVANIILSISICPDRRTTAYAAASCLASNSVTVAM